MGWFSVLGCLGSSVINKLTSLYEKDTIECTTTVTKAVPLWLQNRASARVKVKTERAMREDLTIRLEQFKKQYAAEAAVQGRITKPPEEFIGEESLDLAVSALLQA